MSSKTTFNKSLAVTARIKSQNALSSINEYIDYSEEMRKVLMDEVEVLKKAIESCSESNFSLKSEAELRDSVKRIENVLNNA